MHSDTQENQKTDLFVDSLLSIAKVLENKGFRKQSQELCSATEKNYSTATLGQILFEIVEQIFKDTEIRIIIYLLGAAARLGHEDAQKDLTTIIKTLEVKFTETKDVEAAYHLASALLARNRDGDRDEAQCWFQKTLNTAYEQYEKGILTREALILIINGIGYQYKQTDLKLAEVYYTYAAELGSHEALRNLVELLLQEKKYQEALQFHTQALDLINQQSQENNNLLKSILYQLSRNEDYRTQNFLKLQYLLETKIEIFGTPLLWCWLGVCFNLSGNIEKYEYYFLKAADQNLDLEHKYAACFVLGRSYMERGCYKEAVQYLTKVVDLNIGEYHAVTLKAQRLLKQIKKQQENSESCKQISYYQDDDDDREDDDNAKGDNPPPPPPGGKITSTSSHTEASQRNSKNNVNQNNNDANQEEEGKGEHSDSLIKFSNITLLIVDHFVKTPNNRVDNFILELNNDYMVPVIDKNILGDTSLIIDGGNV